jgi:predicted phage terminase large subunit-like protein
MMNWQPSPAEAAEELLRRREARRRLVNFTNYTFPQYVAEPAHALIADTLDAILARQALRVMIFAPPQHGKSELVSVRLPAYWLGRRPDDPIILTSYAASLAEDKSRQARRIVESEEYQRLFFEVGTPRDSRSVGHWTIEGRRGGMLAAGVGGPITGHGAALGIIDDPFENWEQAQSQTYRDRVWDWWKSTFRTRIWEGGAIVLVMSRWHEDDLAGRLIGEQGDEWMIIRLPALAEAQDERDENNKRLKLAAGLDDALGRAPGEPLCPRRFSRAALGAIKCDVGSQVWGAEYQGVPRAPEGNRFKRAWFPIVRAAPVHAQRVRYWDKAGTAGGGAFTAGVLIAEADKRYYIEDSVRGQWSAFERENTILQTAKLDTQRGHVVIWHEQEPGSGGKDSAEATTSNLAGFTVYADRPTGDKDVRMEPFAAQAEAGNVFLIEGAWNQAWLEEICAIPSGKFRDQADGTSGAFNKLAGAHHTGFSYEY